MGGSFVAFHLNAQGATAADCDRLLPSENDEKADLETGKFILTPLKP